MRTEFQKTILKKVMGISLAGCMSVTMLAGCGKAEELPGESIAVQETEEPVQDMQVDVSALTTPGVKVDLVGEYSPEELAGTWDDTVATKITLSGNTGVITDAGGPEPVIEDGVLSITAGGVYVLSGEGNVQVVVDVDEESQVQLVLNGLTLTNDHTAPVNIVNGSQVMITLAEGTENHIVDTREAYVEDVTEETAASEEELIEGAIFSEIDLVINGSGSLTIDAGFDDGVRTKDHLKLIDGTYHVTCQDDAFVGKDSISINSGNYVVNALGAAFKSNNEEDLEKGFVVVDGGTFDLTAIEGDGFHGEFVLVINDGDILIRQAEEGLEAMNILINGGTIDLMATDDGINVSEADGYSETFALEWAEEIAAQEQRQEQMMTRPEGGQPPEGMERPEGEQPPEDMQMNEQTEEDTSDEPVDHIPGALIINGGTINVTAQGDGLDSNGDILIAGGTTTVCGPTSSGNGSLDYADSFYMTGGILAISGNQGMEQSVVSAAIPVVTAVFDRQQAGGTGVAIAAEDGTVLFDFVAEQDFEYVAFASSKLQLENSYTVTAGDVSVTATASVSNEGMGPGKGGRGGMPQGGENPPGSVKE